MKLTYINEKNMSISLAYSAPYFLQSIEGEDGLSNQIISSNNRFCCFYRSIFYHIFTL